MPLIHSKSDAALKTNIRTLMHEIGKSPHVKSRKQALAVAFSTQRRGKANGGPIAGFAEGGSPYDEHSQAGVGADVLLPPPRNPAAPPEALAQKLREAAQHTVDWAKLPGQLYSGQLQRQPSVPGYWSDEDEAVQQLNQQRVNDWAASTAYSDVFWPRAGGVGQLTSGAGSKIVQPEGIRAYHGSPHDFDRFDMSKIGTGEGAQSYGHGLYFAENPATARSYRESLGGKEWTVDGRVVGRYGEIGKDPIGNAAARLSQQIGGSGIVTKADVEAAKARLTDVHARNPGIYHDKEVPPIFAAMDDLIGRRVADKFGGKTYEVDINAKPEQFLDWDRPLAKQSTDVVSATEPFLARHLANVDNPNPAQRTFADWAKRARNGDLSGREIYSAASSDPTNATAALREAGIPGIKYLDQGSRFPTSQINRTREGEWMLGEGANAKFFPTHDAAKRFVEAHGTSNYVVFDDKLIDILRKYGIGGLGMVPPAAAMNQERPIAGFAAGGTPRLSVNPSHPQGHVGPINSLVGGRTDHHAIHVPSSSDVLPADHVSGLGQGNTGNGMAILSKMFPKSIQKPVKPRLRRGGSVATPIMAAGGEFVVSPDDVADLGDGDHAHGHKVLDHWVKLHRKKLVKTLQKLPGPARG